MRYLIYFFVVILSMIARPIFCATADPVWAEPNCYFGPSTTNEQMMQSLNFYKQEDWKGHSYTYCFQCVPDSNIIDFGFEKFPYVSAIGCSQLRDCFSSNVSSCTGIVSQSCLQEDEFPDVSDYKDAEYLYSKCTKDLKYGGCHVQVYGWKGAKLKNVYYPEYGQEVYEASKDIPYVTKYSLSFLSNDLADISTNYPNDPAYDNSKGPNSVRQFCFGGDTKRIVEVNEPVYLTNMLFSNTPAIAKGKQIVFRGHLDSSGKPLVTLKKGANFQGDCLLVVNAPATDYRVYLEGIGFDGVDKKTSAICVKNGDVVLKKVSVVNSKYGVSIRNDMSKNENKYDPVKIISSDFANNTVGIRTACDPTVIVENSFLDGNSTGILDATISGCGKSKIDFSSASFNNNTNNVVYQSSITPPTITAYPSNCPQSVDQNCPDGSKRNWNVKVAVNDPGVPLVISVYQSMAYGKVYRCKMEYPGGGFVNFSLGASASSCANFAAGQKVVVTVSYSGVTSQFSNIYELSGDSDLDGLVNWCESHFTGGKNGKTPDPNKADSDGDGAKDGAEDKNQNCKVDLNETDPTTPQLVSLFFDPQIMNLDVYLLVLDTDSDGILDYSDNCISESNPDQADTDGDGYGDACDLDDDGDAVFDVGDNCLLISNSDQKNTDGDSVGDACDPDDDGDFIYDTQDNCILDKNKDQADLGKDGKGDVCDSDDDNDGILDTADNCPLTANTNQVDTDKDAKGNACDDDDDGDGILDKADNCSLVANANQLDVNGNEKGDACEADWDKDSIPDSTDNCIHVVNTDQIDTDKDSKGDACDDDKDGDGILDKSDNCQLIVNSGQLNVDKDAFGDACDDDNDNDGVVNGKDNCPLDANKDQIDSDKDKKGDACDDDDDNDGILDTKDDCPYVVNVDQTDLDGDLMGDACDNDADGDGIVGKNDNCPKFNSINLNDTDFDGLGDVCDDDTDGDGILNKDDNAPYVMNPDQTDSNDDGLGDVVAVGDKDSDGAPDVEDNAPDVPNVNQSDVDNDGQGDVVDDDLDGDGVVNEVDNEPAVSNPDQKTEESNVIVEESEELDSQLKTESSETPDTSTPAETSAASSGGCSLVR